MFAGVALIGVLAGSLASFLGFGERYAEAADDAPAENRFATANLETRLLELEEAIASGVGFGDGVAVHARIFHPMRVKFAMGVSVTLGRG
jgi:hypothetical protein